MKNEWLFFTLLILFILSCQKGISKKIEQERYVDGQILISQKLPKIKITLDESFTYQGKFDFKIEILRKVKDTFL